MNFNYLDGSSNTQKFIQQCQRLHNLLKEPDKSVPSLSAWSTHNHLEHLLLASEGILDLIINNEVPTSPRRRSLLGKMVLIFGFIPRGKGKSPDFILPKNASLAQLETALQNVTAKVASIPAEVFALGRPLGEHPYFGSLTAREWLRFICIHNDHHLRIIDEINAA